MGVVDVAFNDRDDLGGGFGGGHLRHRYRVGFVTIRKTMMTTSTASRMPTTVPRWLKRVYSGEFGPPDSRAAIWPFSVGVYTSGPPTISNTYSTRAAAIQRVVSGMPAMKVMPRTRTSNNA